MAANYAIFMSDSVFDEITRKELPGADEYRLLLQQEQLQILPLPNPQAQSEADVHLQKLDRGERDTIRLFHEGYADFVVTDDGAAARFCLSSGVPFVNSLLLLRLLHHSTPMDENSYQARFQALLALGRYSKKVIEYARNCPEKELEFFLP